jgi:hypothetical protein
MEPRCTSGAEGRASGLQGLKERVLLSLSGPDAHFTTHTGKWVKSPLAHPCGRVVHLGSEIDLNPAARIWATPSIR